MLPLEDYPTSAAVFDIINMESKQRRNLQRSNLNKLTEQNRWIEIAAIYANKEEIPAKLIQLEFYKSIAESCSKLTHNAEEEIMRLIPLLTKSDISAKDVKLIEQIGNCFRMIDEINSNEQDIPAKLKKITDEYIKIKNHQKEISPTATADITETYYDAHESVLSQRAANISTPLDPDAFASQWNDLNKQRKTYHNFGQFFIELISMREETIDLIRKINENILQYNKVYTQIKNITMKSESDALILALSNLNEELVTIIKELGKNVGYEFNTAENGNVTLNKISGTNKIPLYVVNDAASLAQYIEVSGIGKSNLVYLFQEYFKVKNFVNIPQMAFDLVLLLTNQGQSKEACLHYQHMLFNSIEQATGTAVLDELLNELFHIAISMKNIDTITNLYIFTQSTTELPIELGINHIHIEQSIMAIAAYHAADSEESKSFVLQLIALLYMNTNDGLRKNLQYQSSNEITNKLLANKHYIALALVTSDPRIILEDEIKAIAHASTNQNNKNTIMQLAKMGVWQDKKVKAQLGDNYAEKMPDLAAAITKLAKLFEKIRNPNFPDNKLDEIAKIVAYGNACMEIITQLRNVKDAFSNAVNIGADQAGDKESHETETEHLTETLTPQQKRNNFLSAQQALTAEQRIPHTIDELVAALTDNKMHQEITDEIYAQTILFLQKYMAEKPEITTVIERLQAETQINTFNIMCLLHAVYPDDMKLKKLFVKICRTENVKNIEQEIQRLSDTENKNAAQEEKLATITEFKKFFLPTTSEIYTFIKLLNTGEDIKPAHQAKYLKINAETDLDKHKEWLFAQTEQQLSEQLQRQKHNAEAANIEHILWVIFAEKNECGKEELIKEINEILFIQPTDIDLAIASALVFDPKATALLSMIDAMDAEAIDSALQKWETLMAQINTTIQNILQNKLALKQDTIASTNKLQAMYQKKLTEFDIYRVQQSLHLDKLEQDIADLSRILGHEKKLSLTRPQITIATPNFAAAPAAEHLVTALSTPENIKAMGEHIASLDTDIQQIKAADNSMAELTKHTDQEISEYKTACADYITKLQDFKTKITDSFVSKNPKSQLNNRLNNALQDNASLTTAHQHQEIQMGEMEEKIRKLEEQMAGNIKKLRAKLATSAKEAAAKAAQIKEIEENIAKLKAELATSINESAAKAAIINQQEGIITALEKNIIKLNNTYIKSIAFFLLKSHADRSKSHRATNDVTNQLAAAPATAALFQPIKYRQLIEYNYLQKNIFEWFENILDGILADRATSPDKKHVDHLTMFKTKMLEKTAACITILPNDYNSELKDEETRMLTFAEHLLRLMSKAVRGLTLHKEAYSYINEIFAAEANVLANLSRELAKNLCRPQQKTAAAPEPAKHKP